jgi:hypothetical protein
MFLQIRPSFIQKSLVLTALHQVFHLLLSDMVSIILKEKKKILMQILYYMVLAECVS